MHFASINSFGQSEFDQFTIELRPTSKCNFNCYYCTDLHINTNKIVPLRVKNIGTLIENIRNNTNKQIHIFVCGGEPTVYSRLNELIVGVSAHMVNDDYITIQSNLSKSIEWWEKFIDETKSSPLVINGSYHNTQNVKILDYIKKCMFLKKSSRLGMISFGYNKQKPVLSDYKLACSMIGQEHCEIVPLINASVDQDPAKGNGTDDEIDFLNENESIEEYSQYGHFFQDHLPYTTSDGVTGVTSRNYMWLTRKNNFSGYSCSIPQNKIYIDWDGNCYKCFNEQFSQQQPIFNINSCDTSTIEKYTQTMSCMKCPFTTCFFDLEYQKTACDKHVDIVKIDRQHNCR